ncbi:MAG: hypothetical protein J6B12_01755 [Clostridia bacterium]|nr:hypothetical protein [Clostridia bacterium]
MLFIFIQKQELATLSVSNKENYIISLATRRRYEHKEGDIPTFKNNVTGFALEKIECQAPYERFRITSSTSSSDAELIDKINTLIKEGQFDTDRLRFSITSSEAMSEDIFKDMNYDSITILRKTQKLVWISIKYENLDLEALKDLSNMEIIEYIGISLGDMTPDTPD